MINEHINDIKEYCKDITSKKILSGIYTQKAVKRFNDDLKRQKDEDFLYEFNEEKAIDIIEFAEKLFIPDLNGKLLLLPWMKFIYANLFGWVHKYDNNRRRFRSAYIEVARKNSKTTSLLFPIILYDFKRTNFAESYFVSKDGAQSAKTYNELKQIYIESFNVDRKTFITESGIRIGSKFIQFFSSEARGTDSYKNSISVIDEFHSYDNDKIITSFRYGGRARKNNLVLIITSAGNDISKPCYTENEKARKILNNILTDETYFTVIYAYDNEDDWKDKKLFIKANPSLNTIIEQSTLELDLQDALITPSHQSDFKAKTLGIWTNESTSWIPLQKWNTNIRNRNVSIDEFIGESCYIGIDLSSTNDFTAYTKCFYRDGFYYLFHKFYVPSEKIEEKYKTDNINIKNWIQNGIVTAISGSVIDYEYLIKDITKDTDIFNIEELAYDKWNSNRFIDKLEDTLPKTLLIEFDQSLKKMSQPTKNFEKLIYEDRIIDSNPVMVWMVSNAVIHPDVNNNYKPLKQYKSSTARIDGVITAIMSIERCEVNLNNNINDRDFADILKLFN